MNNCLKINKFLCFLSTLYLWKWHYFQKVPKSCSAVASANGRFFWRPMNLTCKLLFPLLFFNTYSTHNNIQYDIKAKKNKIKEDDVVDDLLLLLQPDEEKKSTLDDHVERHICLGVRYWPHTLLNFGRIVFKSTNFMRNMNFHL